MPILTVNVGSSTAKLAVFEAASGLRRLATADVIRSDAAALEIWPETLSAHAEWPDIVVHRLVHGGDAFTAPTVLTPDILDRLRQFQPLAPDHMPPALDAVASAIRLFPSARQVACFDTAFHHDMPETARMFPLPRHLWNSGIRRYGFHGLSCESVMEQLGRIDSRAAAGRVIVAHLGSGASLTAIRGGRSVDTTMGFSPAGGVMMSRRSGDLDPGVLIHLLTEEDVDVRTLRKIVTHDAGLQGVSERTGDMRELLAAESADPHAAQAIAMYCYSATKAVGSLMAVLGGLDTLVFTGGIGEHAAPIRERILAGLADLGFELDPEANRRHAAVISTDGARVTVRVLSAAENHILAAHAVTLLGLA